MTKPGMSPVTLTCPALKPSGGLALNNGTPTQGSWTAPSALSSNTCTAGGGGANYDVRISMPSALILSAAGSDFAITGNSSSQFSFSGGPVPGGQGVAAPIPAFSMAWTNGAGATPSTVSLSNYLLGTTSSPYYAKNGWTARITGQWNVTTTGGGLITALP